MVTIRKERRVEAPAREALLDVAYGPSRFGKPSQRLREGRGPAPGLSFVALDQGRVVGTVRLWTVAAGRDRRSLLLGPLAVHPDCRGRGIGAALVRHAVRQAAQQGYGSVILVGDVEFYGRFGFSAAAAGRLRLAGNPDPRRLLALELVPGALADARGAILAESASEPPTRRIGAAGAGRGGLPRAA